MIEEIGEDLYRIEMPLPEVYPKSVNAYVIRDGERNLIIDAGLQDDKCMHAMQAGIKNLDIDLKKTDFFISHGHSDHIGLLPKLIHAGSVVYPNRLEADFMQRTESGVLLLEFRELCQMSGFPEGDFEKIVPLLVRHDFTSRDIPRFQFLEDGETMARGKYQFTRVEAPGHNKGHMCLYEPDRKIFISGDHLLKDFSPIIPGRINNDNPLKEYLFSLDKVYALDIEIVLPGHGRPFRNSRQRIEEMKGQHHQQNRKILSILREGGKNTYETSLRMTRKRNSDLTTFSSILESFFFSQDTSTHLRYLEEKGKIKRTTKGKVAIYSLHETS